MKKFRMLLVICLAGLLSTGCTRSVDFIAHRGASHLAPENTMSSVMLGWEKGAHVEIDVHLSSDNRVVVIHDKTTKRTGKRELTISKTDSETLRSLDVGSFKSPDFAGEKIPFLEEVVEAIPAGKKLFIEIKSDKRIVPYVETIIKNSGKESQIVIIGFDLETVSLAKKQMPNIPVYWLRGTEKDKVTGQYIGHDVAHVQTAIDHGLNGLNVHYGGLTETFAQAVRGAGLKLYVWTVDEPYQAMRMIELHVDGITTNRPQWLRENLEVATPF